MGRRSYQAKRAAERRKAQQQRTGGPMTTVWQAQGLPHGVHTRAGEWMGLGLAALVYGMIGSIIVVLGLGVYYMGLLWSLPVAWAAAGGVVVVVGLAFLAAVLTSRRADSTRPAT